MNDLISRAAAIDAIDKYSVWVTYTQGDLQKDEAEFVENIIKQTKKAIQSMLIEDLPSAQPIQTASNYLQSLPTSPLLVGKMPSAQPELPDWVQKVEEYRKSAPSIIHNPLAWALYQTWKEYNGQLVHQRGKENR